MSIFGATAWAVISAVTTIASIAYQQINARKVRKKQKEAEREAAEKADAAKGLQIPVEATVMNIPVLYGRGKVGGLRTYHKVAHVFYAANPEANTRAFTSSGGFANLAQSQSIAKTSVPATSINTSSYNYNGTSYQSDPYPYTYNDVDGGLVISPESANITATDSNQTITGTLSHTGGIYYYLSGLTDTSDFTVGQVFTIDHESWNPASTATDRLTYKVHSIESTALVLTGYDVNSVSGYGLFGYQAASSGLSYGGYGGALSENKAGERNELLIFRQVLCYEGINDALHVIVNNESIYQAKWDLRAHVHKIGSGGCALVNTNFPEEASSHYPLVAHATGACWLNRDDPQFSGVPDLSFVLEGLRVQDIVKSGDNFSLGSLIYSNSPPLVLLDYLLNKEYGAGVSLSEIDLESFYWAHKCASRLVQVADSGFYPPVAGDYWTAKQVLGVSHTVSLYEANIVLDTGSTVRENIENILDCMQEAELVWVDGRYRLLLAYPQEYKATFDTTSLGPITGGVCVPGTAAYYNTGDIVQYPPGTAADVDLYMSMVDYNDQPPLNNSGVLNPYWVRGPRSRLVEAYITDDDIILGTEILQSWTSANDKLNFHTTRFLNEAKGFNEDSASWPPKYDSGNSVYATYLSEDRGIPLESEAFAKGITDYYHALANSEAIVRSSRYNAAFACSLSRKFIYLEPGGFIKVTSEILGIYGELYRLDSIKVDDKGDVAIECHKYDARNLAWNAKDNEVVAQRSVYSDELRQATNLVFMPNTSIGIESGGTITWTEAADPRVVQYCIKLTYTLMHQVVPGQTSWVQLGTSVGTSFTLPAMAAKPMTATVIAMDVNGRMAPEYNIRTGSRWPLVSLVPIDAYLPLMATLSNSTIIIPDDINGLPDLTNANGYYRISRGNNIYNAVTTFSVTGEENVDVTISNSPGTEGVYEVVNISGLVGKATLVAEIEGTVFERTLSVFYNGLEPDTGGSGATPAPTSFTLDAGITFYSVEHPQANFTVNGGYQATRIYAAEKLPGAVDDPELTDANMILQSAGRMFYINSNPATTWFVWISWLANNGVESTIVGPHSVRTGEDVSRLLEALGEMLGESELNIGLKDRLDTIEAGVLTNTSDLTLLASDISTLNTLIGEAQATIQEESQIRSDDYNTLVTTINNLQINNGDTFIGLEEEALIRETVDDGLLAQWTVKTDINGFVSGFGLASTEKDGVPYSVFKMDVNSFAIGAPGAGYDSAPVFAVQTNPAVVNGQDVPAGVYMIDGYIKNGTITSAKIGHAAVDSANIKDAAVDTLQIKGNAVTIPVYFSDDSATTPVYDGGGGGGGYQLIASNTLVMPPNSDVLLFLSCTCNNQTGDLKVHYAQVTGDIGNGEYLVGTHIGGTYNNNINMPFTWFCKDRATWETSQTVTYRFYVMTVGSGLNGWYFQNRRMIVMGCKR